MKFRYKLIIVMISLLGLSFGIGGTILIDRSFKSSLSYATENFLQNYQSVQNTFLITADINSSISYDDLSNILNQLTSGKGSAWVNVALTNNETSENIYSYNPDFSRQELTPSENSPCLSTIWKDNDSYYYQISGIVNIKQEAPISVTYECQLDIVYNITSVYASRIHQQNTFRILLIIIFIAGGVLAVLISGYLTKPLKELSQMVRNLSSGDLKSRANIHSGDEFETLANNFNVMADTIENNISDLEFSIEKQEQFMGSFAHELKTPMTSIIGYADLLRSHSMDENETSEAANYIFSEGKRLESLSLKLLDLLVVKNQETILLKSDPSLAIKNVINIMKPELAKENITLKSSCRKGSCMLDIDLFQSLIINIIDNARKAIDGSGLIHVAGTIKDDKYVIIIKDNGRGMPQEEISRISEAFYRIDKSRSRAQGGAGLGLAICSKIAEIHNAEIKYKSEPGKGTVVTISLPSAKEVSDEAC